MKKPFVKRWLEKLEATATAVAFAEEGEAETARKLLEEAGEDQSDGRDGVRAIARPPQRGAAPSWRSRA